MYKYEIENLKGCLWKQIPYNAQRTERPIMNFADTAGQDQLTEAMDTVVYVFEQRMSRSDCMDAHTDLDLRCSQNG